MSELSLLKRRVLITSGPTREYIDPVRFLSNGSSGRMGAALAKAALADGWDVTIISGPVTVEYPKNIHLIRVTTTEEMLQAAIREFPTCNGVIGAAAPCDYKPVCTAVEKISKKNGKTLQLELVETSDILATLGQMKNTSQWLIAFALETSSNKRERAIAKLHRKNGDLVLLNEPGSIFNDVTRIEAYNKNGERIATLDGAKEIVARDIFRLISDHCRAAHY